MDDDKLSNISTESLNELLMNEKNLETFNNKILIIEEKEIESENENKFKKEFEQEQSENTKIKRVPARFKKLEESFNKKVSSQTQHPKMQNKQTQNKQMQNKQIQKQTTDNKTRPITTANKHKYYETKLNESKKKVNPRFSGKIIDDLKQNSLKSVNNFEELRIIKKLEKVKQYDDGELENVNHKNMTLSQLSHLRQIKQSKRYAEKQNEQTFNTSNHPHQTEYKKIMDDLNASGYSTMTKLMVSKRLENNNRRRMPDIVESIKG